MTIDHGMNVSEVESLARDLREASARLDRITALLESAVTPSAWRGPAGDRFRQQHWPTHRMSLRRASTGLADFSSRAQEQTRQQLAASRSDSDVAPTGGAFLLVPLVVGPMGLYVYLRGKWKRVRDNSPLYSSGNGDTDAIDPDDVKQGGLGDCFLLSNLQALAQQDPDAIRRLIRDNGNGTFTVTFYEQGMPVEVTVSNEFLVQHRPLWFDERRGSTGDSVTENGVKLAGAGDGELWVRIIEKAYAERFHGGYAGYDGGGSSNVAYERLTGVSPSYSMVSAMSTSDIDGLAARLHSGEALVANTYPRAAASGLSDDARAIYDWKNIYEEHSYSVSRIDTQRQLVYLDNPHGKDDLVLTYEEYTKTFEVVQFAATERAVGE